MSGGDRQSAAKMGRSAIKSYPFGLISYDNLYKFLYCHFGGKKARINGQINFESLIEKK